MINTEFLRDDVKTALAQWEDDEVITIPEDEREIFVDDCVECILLDEELYEPHEICIDERVLEIARLYGYLDD